MSFFVQMTNVVAPAIVFKAAPYFVIHPWSLLNMNWLPKAAFRSNGPRHWDNAWSLKGYYR